ncbi:MAG: hypothetical protein JWQ24_353 [Tardiphaga sp.]|nr:hypothetical protein [Tardiphaga sp.]
MSRYDPQRVNKIMMSELVFDHISDFDGVICDHSSL